MAKIQLPADTLLTPTPVALVSCQVPGERPNLITIAWLGVASSGPPQISIAIRPSRHSFKIIEKTRECVVNIPSESMVEAVDICGIKSGRNNDKWALTGLTPVYGTQVAAPMVAEAPICMECKVREVLDLNMHHLFVCEVVALHVEENATPEGKKLDIAQVAPICYIPATHEYRAMGKVLGLAGFSLDKLR